MADLSMDTTSKPKRPSLPAELWLHIFSFLPITDIKNARLAYPPFRDLPGMFRRVYLSCHPDDLQIFEAVAEDDVLSSEVQEIVYDISYVPPELPEPSYRFERRIQKKRPAILRPIMLNAYEYNSDFVFLHRRNLLRNRDRAALVRALPRLTRLRQIKITPLSFGKLLERTFKRNLPNALHSPAFRRWMRMRDLFHAQIAERFEELTAKQKTQKHGEVIDGCFNAFMTPSEVPRLRARHDPILEYDTDPSSRAIKSIFTALQGVPNIGDLRLDMLDVSASVCPDYNYYRPGMHLFTPFLQEIRSTGPFLGNLREIKLALKANNNDDFTHNSEIANNNDLTHNEYYLSRFLSAAQSLRELSLDLSKLQIARVLQNIRCPKLHTLRMTGGTIARMPFISFLKHHRKELKSLYLTDCDPGNGDWRDILKEMQTETRKDDGLSLQHCEFSRLIRYDPLSRWAKVPPRTIYRYLNWEDEQPLKDTISY